eukprot:gene3678-6492_t
MGNKFIGERISDEKIKDYDVNRDSLNYIKLQHTKEHTIDFNPENFNKSKKNCKILLVGQNRTGRTTLVDHLSSSKFKEQPEFDSENPFINTTYEYQEKVILIDDITINLKFIIPKRKELLLSFIQSVNGIMFCYEVGNKLNFEMMKSYHQLIINDSKLHPETKMIVVATKKDEKSNEEIIDEDVQKFIAFYEYPYIETSSKTSYNIKKTFELMLQEIYFPTPKNDLKLSKFLKQNKIFDVSFRFR